MILNGIDLSELDGMQAVVYPAETPGRTAYIDADFIAYECSVDREGEERTTDDMLEAAQASCEHYRKLAGATKAVMHLTPDGSTKGGRRDIAIQQEYQGNRNTDKPEMLHTLRELMHRELGAVLHFDQEADDGVAQAQYAAIKAGNTDLSCIVSKDKDLRMVPGLHLCTKTNSIINVSAFGSIQIDSKGKLTGYGTKFFWAQMLMGDTADNIRGLPAIHADIMKALFPTQAVINAKAKLLDLPQDHPKRGKYIEILNSVKHSPCGAAKAYALLQDARDDTEAFVIVRDLYKRLSDIGELRHWRTCTPVKWSDVFLSEAKMLWLRRTKAEDDVMQWMRENCFG